MEDGIAHMHVARVSVFEGPAPAVGDLGKLLTSKLHLIPSYRSTRENHLEAAPRRARSEPAIRA
jgi:hypothetical protein